MRTLLILSHPDIQNSATQQFLIESARQLPEVTLHHLESSYPDRHFDLLKEQQLLRDHERILFQFPFYWYSAPALLKQWQEEVLTAKFAYQSSRPALLKKEFGLVITASVPEREYQAGSSEQFTIAELTRPFQALANKCQMIYLPPFFLTQFAYQSENEKMWLLIRYQQYLSKESDPSLKTAEAWFLQQLQTTGMLGLTEKQQQKLELVIRLIQENRETLDDLIQTVKEMKEAE